MKKLIFILMMLFIGCAGFKGLSWTTQDLYLSAKIRAGMTTDEVLAIMGDPIFSELDMNVEEWHYCTTGSGHGDSFVALFFVDNKIIAKKQYKTHEGLGSCENFVKMGDYKIPLEVQAILDKNTTDSLELKEPKEPIEPEEGVMPIVPKVEIPNQPNPPKTEEDE